MHIAIITVSPRKGESVRTQWELYRERPFPSIDGGSCFRWRNGGGVFPEFGNPGGQIKDEYSAFLLRDGFVEGEREHTRHDYAGYDGAPGTLTLRGRDLGEMSLKVNLWGREHSGFNCMPRVRGFDIPSPGESDWIRESILPGILDYIRANRADLYREAVDGIADTLAERVEHMRQAAAELETGAAEAVARLRNMEP